jgi:tRNA (guanine37-N1)-methyltransferase
VVVGLEQWGIKIHRSQGETVRRALLAEDALDTSLRLRCDEEYLILPLTAFRAGAQRFEFEMLPVSEELPRHELIGGIALMQERDPAGAALLLASRPSLHTVLFALSAVEGEYRTRRFEVLAGEPTTKTRYREYGLHFDIDLSQVYFSARLSEERQRIFRKSAARERVLDMFAGAGPFAITLAGRADVVVACDINPAAVSLLIHNVMLNRRKNVVAVLADAARLPSFLRGGFDRIIMNLPVDAHRFLPAARSLCRDGGTMHFYALQERAGEYLPLLRTLGCRTVAEREVRSYSPGRWHAVYDITVE